MAMIADMMGADGRVFLKSEWTQVSADWPCLSFSKRSVADRLQDFDPARDVLIYVGTSNGKVTRDRDFRSRLISAVTIDPTRIEETRALIPADVWDASEADWGDRWRHAMRITAAANLAGPPYPRARDIIPQAYRSFSRYRNRGNIVRAEGAEREAVRRLPIQPLSLAVESDTAPPGAGHIQRMAALIIDRVNRGGDATMRTNPLRHAPDRAELIDLLRGKLRDQNGMCALCGGALVLDEASPMLQPSADRIDSTNVAYDANNVWITHLACNLAKNRYGAADFARWLSVLRGSPPRS